MNRKLNKPLRNPLSSPDFSWLSRFLIAIGMVMAGMSSVQATTSVFAPTDDARVNYGYPFSNYGSDTVLRVRSNGTSSHESYLKFSVTGLTGAPTSAVLRLYVTDGSPDGGDVYLVDNGWDEFTITADSAPVISGSPVASTGSVPAGVTIEVDVTSAITGSGTYSFGMRSASTNSAFYSSKEGTNPPELVIQGTGGPAAPGLSKSFGPNPIIIGGTSTLTLAIDNSANTIALTGLELDDTYPVEISNAATPNITNTCGGSVTALAGTGSVSLSGGTVAAGGSCTVTVDVTSLTEGAHLNTSGMVGSVEAPDSTTASAILTVNAIPVAPSLSKSFGPNPITAGGTSTLTLTIDNSANGTPLTSLALLDTYPGTISNAAAPNVTNTCGGTVTAVAGAGSINLIGGSVAANGSCTVTVDVTSLTVGDYLNTTDVVSSTEAPDSNVATDTLTVNATPVAPGLSKSFGPNPINVGDTSTLTLTVDNSANAIALTGLQLNDTYPPAISNAVTPNVTNTCGGTVTASAGAGSVTLTGGTVAAGSSCIVMVDVTSSIEGAHLNTSGVVGSVEAPNSMAASDTLTVNPTPQVLFSFAQISDSQPFDAAGQANFEQVLDTLVEAGQPGALIPRPVKFVLFAGDLVDKASSQAEWLTFLDTIDSRLTVNAIPYRAVPGSHDQNLEVGITNYELYIADSGVWDTDVDIMVGDNGPTVTTGWSGLRIIGFNNSNADYNQISSVDLAMIEQLVVEASARNENIILMGHHPHDDLGMIPLATSLENPDAIGYIRGHSGSAHATQGLSNVTNPNIWDLNSNDIMDDGAILYFDVYKTHIEVYPIRLVLNSTTLPAPSTIQLVHPLSPDGPPTAPGLSKRFEPNPIPAGATSTLILTIDNSANAIALTGLQLNDTYPVAISNAETPFITNTCGGTVTALAGAGSVSLIGGSVAAGSSCTLTVDVTSLTEGTHLNTSGVVSSVEVPDSATASDSLTVTSPSTNGAFSPTDDARVSSAFPSSNYGSDTVLRVRNNGTSSHESYLKFNVTDFAGAPTSAVLRLYVENGSPDGGDVYLVDNGWDESTITANNAPVMSGSPVASTGSVPAGVTIEVDVTSVVTGNGTYSFGMRSASSNSAIYSSKEGANPPELVIQGTGGPAAPGLSKSFGPNTITAGDTSTLNLTIDNGANTIALTGLQLNDTYPVAISNAATPNVTNTCGGSVTALAGGGSVSLTGGTVAAGSSCTVTVDVTSSTAGTHLNTSGVVSSVEVPDSTTASDSLTVTNPGSSGTFSPTDDARVNSGFPTSNYGSDTVLRVRSNSSGSHESYLKFGVTGLTGAPTSAILRLFVENGSPDGGDVYLVGNGWDESTITANNAPAISGSPVASAGPVTTGVVIEVDVTSAITGNGTYSFGMRSASSNSAFYSSKEGASPPELVIQ